MTVADFPRLRDVAGRRDAGRARGAAGRRHRAGAARRRLRHPAHRQPDPVRPAGRRGRARSTGCSCSSASASSSTAGVLQRRLRSRPRRAEADDAEPARRRVRRARQQRGRAAAGVRARHVSRTTRAPCTTSRRLVDSCTATISGAEPLRCLAGRAARPVRAGRRSDRRRRAAGGDEDRAVGAPRAQHAARVVGGAAPRHAALRQAVVHRDSRSASSPTRTWIRIPRRGPASSGSRGSARRSRRALPALVASATGLGPYFARGRDRRRDARRDGRRPSAPAQPLTAEQLAFINEAVEEVTDERRLHPDQCPERLVRAAVPTTGCARRPTRRSPTCTPIPADAAGAARRDRPAAPDGT